MINSEEVLKTFWRCLEDIFGRRLGKTSCRCLENAFKTSSKRVQDSLKMSWRCLEEFFQASWQDLLKASWKHFEGVLKKYMTKANIFVLIKAPRIRLEGLLKTSLPKRMFTGRTDFTKIKRPRIRHFTKSAFFEKKIFFFLIWIKSNFWFRETRPPPALIKQRYPFIQVKHPFPRKIWFKYFILDKQGGLNQGFQLNLCNILSIIVFHVFT